MLPSDIKAVISGDRTTDKRSLKFLRLRSHILVIKNNILPQQIRCIKSPWPKKLPPTPGVLMYLGEGVREGEKLSVECANIKPSNLQLPGGGQKSSFRQMSARLMLLSPAVRCRRTYYLLQPQPGCHHLNSRSLDWVLCLP